MATLTLAVDGVGGNDLFTLTAGATKVIAVAAPDDDDTTRITGSVTNVQDLTFGTSALLVGSSIQAVRLIVRTRGEAVFAGTDLAKARLVVGSPGDDQSLAQDPTYTTSTFTFLLDPAGNPWTKNSIDNCYCQLEVPVTGDTLTVTTVKMEVDYTVGGYESRLPMMGVS